MHLSHDFRPVLIVLAVFIVAGLGTFINIVWGLLTGGPRATQLPGQPRLYDRVYYLLFLAGWSGWCFALLSLPDGFIVGWGIGAIGMGVLYLLRGDMIVKAMEYKAEHGIGPWRFLYRTNINRLHERHASQKIIAVIFIVAGTIVLFVNAAHVPAALADFYGNIQLVTDIVTKFLLPFLGIR
jgi:hypothetical protein